MSTRRVAAAAAPDGVDAAAAAPPSAVPTAAAPSSSAFIRQKLREDEASRAAAEAAARAASLEKRALQELVAAREEAQRHALIRERSARGAAELARPSSARSSRASVGANSAAADTAVTGDAGWFTRSRRGSSASTASTFSVFSSLRGLAAKGGTRVGASAAATTSGTGGGGGDRDADGKRSVGFSDIQEEHPAVKGGRKALKRPASAAVQRRRPLSAAAARRIPPPTDAASEVGTVDTAPALVRRGPEAQRRPPLKSALKRPQSAMPATRAARLGGGTGTGDVGGGGGGVGARGGQGGRAKLPTMAMLRAYSGMLDGATGGGRKELPPLKEHITSRSAFYRAKEEARRAVAARASRSGMLNDETELSGTRALRLTMTSMRLAERNKLRLANKPANGSDDGDSGSDDEVPSVIEGSVVRRRKSRRPQSAKARSSSTVLAVADVSSSALTVSNTARERKPGGPGGLDAYVDAIVEETSEADGSDAGSHQDATSEKGQADADAEPEEHVPTLSEAAAAAAAEAQAALQGATSRRRMRPVLSMTAMAPPSRGLDGAPRPLRLDKRGALRALLGASNAKSARITRTGYGKATSSGGGAAVASEKKEDGDTAHRGDSTATNAPNAAAATPAKQRRESSSSSSSGSSSSGSDGDGARVVKFAEETKAQDGTVTATRGGAGGDPATSRELAKARATQAKRDATARLRAGTQRDAEVAAASLESASAVQRMKRGTAADKRVILNWMEAAKITAVKPVRLLVRRKPPPSGMPAYQVSYASVGATLAIASGAGYVRVWDLPTHPGRRQELRRQLDIPHGAILAVCFSPDDSMVAAAGAEGVLRVWAVDTGKLLGRCYYHLERLMTVHWAPDNSRIVTSGADRTLGLWSVAAMLNPNPAPREIREKKTNRKITTCFEFPILGAPENRQGHVAVVRRAMFTPDSKSVLSCSDDRSIRMWSMEEETLGELMFVFVQHTGAVYAIDITGDGTKMATGGEDRTICLWNIKPGEQGLLQIFTGPNTIVYDVAFSPEGDGRRLASAGHNGSLSMWDVATGGLLQQVLRAHETWVHCVAFEPSGLRLTSAAGDGSVTIWGADTEQRFGQRAATAGRSLLSKLRRCLGESDE